MSGPMDEVIEGLHRELAALRKLIDERPTLKLGTVTSVSPIRVRLDGPGEVIQNATPRTTIVPLVGDHVVVAHQKRVLTILGVLGGRA